MKPFENKGHYHCPLSTQIKNYGLMQLIWCYSTNSDEILARYFGYVAEAMKAAQPTHNSDEGLNFMSGPWQSHLWAFRMI